MPDYLIIIISSSNPYLSLSKPAGDVHAVDVGVVSLAEDHSVEGTVELNAHAHQVLLALDLEGAEKQIVHNVQHMKIYVQTTTFKNALKKYLKVPDLRHVGRLCILPGVEPAAAADVGGDSAAAEAAAAEATWKKRKRKRHSLRPVVKQRGRI